VNEFKKESSVRSVASVRAVSSAVIVERFGRMGATTRQTNRVGDD
jgi:hypothetical protein